MAWGSGGWGSTGWGGGGLGEDLALLSAQPIAENQIRLAFNLPPRFTGLLDPADASNPERFSITADPTSTGEDGLPPRPVLPIAVELALVDGAGGRLLDLFCDRPMGPWPGRYLIAVNQLRASTGELLDLAHTSILCDGLAVAPPSPFAADQAPLGDLANPQTVKGIGPNGYLPPEAAKLLGTFPIDGSGDYGIDAGIASYKKRIIRRLTSRQGGFAHLAARRYGVGFGEAVKTLGRAGVREGLAAEAEAQIRLEPETLDVQVRLVQSAKDPSVTVFVIRAKTRAGEDVGMDVPFVVP